MLNLNKRFMGRATAVLGLSALCSTMLTPVPALAETHKVVTGSECADYTVIGVRGSTMQDFGRWDNENTAKYDEDHKKVPRVEAIPITVFSYAAEAIRETLPSEKSVKFTPVDYKPVDEYIGFNGTLSASPEDYTAAVQSGASSFVKTVEQEASKCSRTKIIAFGFGQGAGVIRVSLEKLNQDSLDKTKAVWFIGDDIHGSSDGFEYYDAGTGWDRNFNGFTRMSQHWHQQKAAAEAVDKYAVLKEEDYAPADQKDIAAPIAHTIPNAFKGRILSMCYAGDALCSLRQGNRIMESSADEYLKHDFLSHGAKWVLNAADSDTVRDFFKTKPQEDGDHSNDSTVMWSTGRGATWVAEDKNDPYAFSNRCISDFAIIGARGSGEPTNGGQDKVTGEIGGKPAQEEETPRIPGFSDILATAAWGVKLRLPQQTTVQFIPIEYPAHAVPGFGGPGESMKDQVGGFLASASDGGENAQKTIERFIDTCPNTKILVMGYSQGAWSVHMALNRMNDNYRNKISGAYLIADPLRDSSDDGAEYFDINSKVYSDVNKSDGKHPGIGVATMSLKFIEAAKALDPDKYRTISFDISQRTGALPSIFDKQQKIPNALRGDVLQVCNDGDGVCNIVIDLSGEIKLQNPMGNSLLVTPPTINLPEVSFVSGSLTRTAIDGFSKIHPVAYKDKDKYQFWAYPPAWGANKLTADFYSLPGTNKEDKQPGFFSFFKLSWKPLIL